MCLVKIVFFLFVLVSLTVEIESMISSSVVSRGRSQSMRPLLQRSRIQTNLNQQPGRSSSSPTLSTTNPLASTSTLIKDRKSSKTCATCDLKEVNLRETEALNEASHVRNFFDIDLTEADSGTYNANLDPSKDGVFARVRKILQRYGTFVAIGSAIGVGGSVIHQHFNNSGTHANTTSLQMSNQNNQTIANNADDELNNML